MVDQLVRQVDTNYSHSPVHNPICARRNSPLAQIATRLHPINAAGHRRYVLQTLTEFTQLTLVPLMTCLSDNKADVRIVLVGFEIKLQSLLIEA